MSRFTEADLHQLQRRSVPTLKPVKRCSPKIPVANEGEILFRGQCLAMRLPKFEQQFKFAPDRRYAADFCWPAFMLIFECQGGAFVQGRHTRGKGFTDDCERRSIAAILGYSIIEATTDQIFSGDAIEWTKRALEARGWCP